MTGSDTVGVVVALLVLAATLSAAPIHAAGTPAPEMFASQGDFDNTEFRITVYGNGSAEWTFLFWRSVSFDTERQNFEAYAETFNENETNLYRDFQTRATSLAAEGENETDRTMTATRFSKEASIEGLNDNRGIVRMSFLWTGFGATTDDGVAIGDVFEGGLYVGPDQTLVITHGEDLVITEFQPRPDDRSDDTLTYRGEREFADNRPAVEFGPPGAATATPMAPSDSATGGGGPGSDGGGLGVLPIVALLVVLALGGGAAYAYRAGMFGGGDGDASATAGGGDDGGDGGAAAAGASSPEPAISDEELLSDDDRVMKMLEERGGRMKQVKIVEETGWSKSKVSMLLSDMEEEGQISKLRVGRENIVSIAGQEPEAAGSPFDDE
jgi:hypothetical protein